MCPITIKLNWIKLYVREKYWKKETRNTQETFSTSSTFYGKSSAEKNELEREGERGERERERAAADTDSIAMVQNSRMLVYIRYRISNTPILCSILINDMNVYFSW